VRNVRAARERAKAAGWNIGMQRATGNLAGAYFDIGRLHEASVQIQHQAVDAPIKHDRRGSWPRGDAGERRSFSVAGVASTSNGTGNAARATTATAARAAR
jgi:hypothetical protein